MKQFLLAILFVLVAHSQSSLPVFASCAQVSVEQQKDMADVIAMGTVTTVTSQNATVQVERYYKGTETPPELVVSGRQSSEGITSVDVEFEEGKKYLLFLKKNLYTGSFLTDICTGTREVSDSLTADEMRVLGMGEEVTVTPVAENTSLGQSHSKNLVWVPMAVAGVAVLFSIPIIFALKHRHKI